MNTQAAFMLLRPLKNYHPLSKPVSQDLDTGKNEANFGTCRDFVNAVDVCKSPLRTEIYQYAAT